MKILSKIALFILHARFSRRRKRYLRTFVLKSECKGNANLNKHQNFFKENSKIKHIFRFVQQNREELRGTSTLNLYPNRAKETILSSLPTLLYIKGYLIIYKGVIMIYQGVIAPSVNQPILQ